MGCKIDTATAAAGRLAAIKRRNVVGCLLEKKTKTFEAFFSCRGTRKQSQVIFDSNLSKTWLHQHETENGQRDMFWMFGTVGEEEASGFVR